MSLNKFNEHILKTNYKNLSLDNQTFVKEKFLEYKFSYQELKQIIDFSIDFVLWNEDNIVNIFKDEYSSKKEAFNHIRGVWTALKNKPNSYSNFSKDLYKKDVRKVSFTKFKSDTSALGACPVASSGTRCCNLMTLDAVQSCGFDCSYCSIQSFYNQNKIGFDENFKKNLLSLKLDPSKTYHIGTGQSSDSLMWGNKEGILDALFDFARANPNVILEFKTKSNNIKYFLENDVPKNIICTWSLSTPTIITNEEHLTASLDKRLAAAKALSDKNVLIGFHFHPIVQYENYLEEYGEVYKRVVDMFDSKKVVLISFGTLTFIKPVMKKIQARSFKTKILQMPFENANGKVSYSLDVKREMFKHAYDSFKAWHEDVYFYLCMENHTLWKEVFGYEYATNDDMEDRMKTSYYSKIKALDVT